MGYIDENGLAIIASSFAKKTTGTSSTAGLTKLYTSTGNNTDGTMTQAAITAAVSNVGIKVGDVTNATISASSSTVSLTWTDPSDVTLNGATLAAWGGTLVVRKTGSAPENIGDGTVVVNSTTRNAYSTTALTDTVPTLDVKYYYRFFPYNSSGAYTDGTSIDVTPASVRIYGVEWDGTSTTSWSRTDASANFTDPNPAVNNGTGSSPFDNCSPWKDMKIVDNSSAGKVVEIPKFWYKWTRSGATMKLQIADAAVSGFYVSPAHADRGDGKGERDVIYVGRYHCSSNYKSAAGGLPKASETRASFRSNIHNLGSTVWQWDYATLWTIQMLYLVEFADWNSQNTIGYGCSSSGSLFNMGATDSMQYHTGTTAASRTTYGSCQYRYIEDLWGNVYDWCDGIYFSGSNVYCIKSPSNFSDSSGGTLVGTRETSGGYISGYTTPTASSFEYALYPNSVNGSDSTYICDYCYYGSSGVVLHVGGSYGQSLYHGLFFLNGNSSVSNSSSSLGSRLLVLP